MEMEVWRYATVVNIYFPRNNRITFAYYAFLFPNIMMAPPPIMNTSKNIKISSYSWINMVYWRDHTWRLSKAIKWDANHIQASRHIAAFSSIISAPVQIQQEVAS